MISRQGFTTITLVVLFAAVAILSSYVLIVAKVKRPVAPRPQPVVLQSYVEDASAGWKIYHNSQYGFEIKFPSNNLTIRTSEVGSLLTLVDLGRCDEMGCDAITVGVEKLPELSDHSRQSIEDYLKTEVLSVTNPDLGRSDFGPVPLKERKTLPGNYPAYKFTFVPDPSKTIESFPAIAQGFINIFKDGYAYSIGWSNSSRFEGIADVMYKNFTFTTP